jgi:predicted membrane protein
MRDKLLRAFMVFMGISVTAWVTSLVISTRLTRGDESSDDFRVATIMNGGEFRSRASNLRSGTAITIMGGVRIDLRDATLDPSGASLELNTMMGGLEVLVPEDWAVESTRKYPGVTSRST